MIVVADTSPINYLILIGEIEILTKMYGRAVIPHAVREELLRPSAPEMVRNWISQPKMAQPAKRQNKKEQRPLPSQSDRYGRCVESRGTLLTASRF
jgi:predicted nucleic acid-binding protein